MTKFDFFSPQNGGNTMKKILSLLAISFSLAFAYTAADVYGAWSVSGDINDALTQTLFGDIVLVFDKNGLDNGLWRFNNGKITFSNSNMYCILISAKMMDCQTNVGKKTVKKAGTIAQYLKVLEQEKKLNKQTRADREQYEKERDRIGEYNEKISQQPFYKSLKQAKESLQKIYNEHINATKGEFESSADFNKRKEELDKNLKDSSVFYFNNALISIVDVIEKENNTKFEVYLKSYNANGYMFEPGFHLGSYNADEQVFNVEFVIGEYVWNNKPKAEIIYGKVKMPPEIAKNLKENIKQFSFRYENTDLRNVDYILMPTKMGIYGTNGERYEVDFDIPNTAKEIVFNSAELWENNPYAKNLSISLTEAIQLKKTKAEEAKETTRKTAEAEATRKATVGEELKKKGGLIDPRNNKKYKVVKIGNQIWMAENLNFDVTSSKCYDNKPENCQKYGRLYDWENAMKACPNGWRLPSEDEFKILMASDASGFEALPGGYYYSHEGFRGIGKNGYLWSSSKSRDSNRYILMSIDLDYQEVKLGDGYGHFLRSVRCLLD